MGISFFYPILFYIFVCEIHTLTGRKFNWRFYFMANLHLKDPTAEDTENKWVQVKRLI